MISLGAWTLRAILEGLEASQGTLRELVLTDGSNAASTFPLDFHVSDLIQQLFSFPKLCFLFINFLPTVGSNSGLQFNNLLALEQVALLALNPNEPNG